MKTAMIWGAGGGIGRALVTELINKDWTVLAVTHHPDGLSGITPHVFCADAAAPYEVQLAVSAASHVADEVNLWVYAAGDIDSVKIADMPSDTWQRIIDANLTGAFVTAHYSLPLLTIDAHLIFVGAISERLRLPGLAAYAAAKSGLEAFTEALSKEDRKRRVSIVRPSAVVTPLWDKVPLRLPANALSPDALAKQILDAYDQGHRGIIDLPQT